MCLMTTRPKLRKTKRDRIVWVLRVVESEVVSVKEIHRLAIRSVMTGCLWHIGELKTDQNCYDIESTVYKYSLISKGVFHCSPTLKQLKERLRAGEEWSLRSDQRLGIFRAVIPKGTKIVTGKNYACSPQADGLPCVGSRKLKLLEEKRFEL